MNFSDLQCNRGNLFENILDHLPNFLIVEDPSVLNKEKFKPQMRDLKHFDQEKFLNELRGVRLEEKLNIKKKGINDKYMFLHNSKKKVKNKNASMKETSSKEAKISKKIWITSAIRKSIKPKNSLLKTFLKNKVFTFIDINTIRKN